MQCNPENSLGQTGQHNIGMCKSNEFIHYQTPSLNDGKQRDKENAFLCVNKKKKYEN